MPSDLPVIETARLRLRAHRAEDLAACAAMWADPIVTRHIGGKPSTRQDVWFKLLRHAGHWSWMGYGYWLVEEKATARFVGEVGFADFKREITPSLEGVPEIGWALATHAHGMGYATEAAKAAIAWGDERFARAPTVCLIDPENVASIRVAEKCGYSELRRATYEGDPTIVFRR